MICSHFAPKYKCLHGIESIIVGHQFPKGEPLLAKCEPRKGLLGEAKIELLVHHLILWKPQVCKVLFRKEIHFLNSSTMNFFLQ